MSNLCEEKNSILFQQYCIHNFNSFQYITNDRTKSIKHSNFIFRLDNSNREQYQTLAQAQWMWYIYLIAMSLR